MFVCFKVGCFAVSCTMARRSWSPSTIKATSFGSRFKTQAPTSQLQRLFVTSGNDGLTPWKRAATKCHFSCSHKAPQHGLACTSHGDSTPRACTTFLIWFICTKSRSCTSTMRMCRPTQSQASSNSSTIPLLRSFLPAGTHRPGPLLTLVVLCLLTRRRIPQVSDTLTPVNLVLIWFRYSHEKRNTDSGTTHHVHLQRSWGTLPLWLPNRWHSWLYCCADCIGRSRGLLYSEELSYWRTQSSTSMVSLATKIHSANINLSF